MACYEYSVCFTAYYIRSIDELQGCTKAYLYGDMGEEVVYILPPDWWPELVQKGRVFLLLKSIYGTRQAASKWNMHRSTWMEKTGYLAVNS
jgi:hypothetical protein